MSVPGWRRAGWCGVSGWVVGVGGGRLVGGLAGRGRGWLMHCALFGAGWWHRPAGGARWGRSIGAGSDRWAAVRSGAGCWAGLFVARRCPRHGWRSDAASFVFRLMGAADRPTRPVRRRRNIGSERAGGAPVPLPPGAARSAGSSGSPRPRRSTASGADRRAVSGGQAGEPDQYTQRMPSAVIGLSSSSCCCCAGRSWACCTAPCVWLPPPTVWPPPSVG